MNIGFSTGSLAKGDFLTALDMLAHSPANVLEVSALRDFELAPLIDAFDDLNLKRYGFVSFHAPSKLGVYGEAGLVAQLKRIAERGIPIVVHPDIITDIPLWKTLGSYLCVENMDMRKPIGRTTKDLVKIFSQLPEATFCFDIAHARQVDPTMMEALDMVRTFGSKIKQLHVSVVNSKSIHESLTFEAILDYRKIAKFIPKDTPIVIESPTRSEHLGNEMDMASLIFDDQKFGLFLDELGVQIHQNTGLFQRLMAH